MCLLVFAWKIHPNYPLLFAGNRDELHARPATAAGFWERAPQVLAGRDLQAGGTWLGITTDARFAVVTNYRSGLNLEKAERSRGELAANFLQSSTPAHVYLQDVANRAHAYGAFSLIVGDHDELWYFSNRSGAEPQEVTPGIHGLSNHLLDTPWPKVTRSMVALKQLLERGNLDDAALFTLLAERVPAPDELLPDTGIGRERERQVSSVFVVNPVYGTRCSSLILLRTNGEARFAERRFDAQGRSQETRIFQHKVCAS